ncbi:MAG: glycosyltransferase [Candidatus Micrarchaeia archaeon]
MYHSQAQCTDQLLQIQNFKYFGFVVENMLPSLITSCHIFIYPSASDNFPSVTLQPLASDLLVVTNSEIVSNFREFVEINQIHKVDNIYESYFKEICRYTSVEIDFDRERSRDIITNKYDWKIIPDRFYDEIRGVGF